MTLEEWRKVKSAEWKTAPISPTCHVMLTKDKLCDQATDRCYPAMGGGWMALCFKHSRKHYTHSFGIQELIKGGERFE